jgi:general secretion pathway protein F
MPRFHYVAIDVDGRERRGGVDAPDAPAARASLQKKKLLPVEVLPIERAPAPRREAAAAVPAGRGRARLTHKARLLFTRQLATLIGAALPVDEALAMIAAQQERAADARVLRDVQEGVLEGQRLASALARHPHSFSPLYRAAVAGGERTGRLGFVLERLADYLARADALRTKITTAMIYPAALSVIAITVVTCLMIFVVPTLSEQFRSFDAELPLLTQIMIDVSDVLTRFWPVLLALIAGGALLVRSSLRQPQVRFAIDRATLAAPIVGRQAIAISASRFIRAVSTLVSSGLPVLDSVRAARESVPNRYVAQAVDGMAEAVEAGESLSAAMRKSGVIPPMVVYMAASGENAGELPLMLDKAADHMDQEFESFTAAALSLLEPAIIVFMGLVVASIVLAIMLPILRLNQLAIG